MKYSFKKILIFGILNLSILTVWIVMMSCFGGGNSQPDIRTIYAGIGSWTAPALSTTNANLGNAEGHASNNTDDLEDLVTNQYVPGSYMYLQYGVSTFNCTDHDHLNAITVSNGHSAVGFSRDVRYSGTVWIQLVSQCEEDFDSDPNGNGAYFKGTEWYSAYNYPETPNSDIWIDQSFITNCQYPGDRVPGATEYGCGSNDVNHDD